MRTNCVVLSRAPLVATAYLFRDVDRMRGMLRDRQAFMLFFLFNYETPESVAEKVRILRTEYPKVKFRLAVDRSALFEALRHDFPEVVFAHQNALVDDRIFKPKPNVPTLYDAVYTAATTDGKRHALADAIPSWLWITYMPNAGGRAYFERTRAALRNVRTPQFVNGRYWHWDNRQVAHCLNEANVGLCLSAHEGGMWAVTEYLLAGLPVVVTNDSVGGMHTVLPPDCCAYVEPAAAAVSAAARELAERRIPRQQIRAAAQAVLRPHLLTIQEALQSLCDEAGAARDVHADWGRIFFDKFYRWQTSPLLLKG